MGTFRTTPPFQEFRCRDRTLSSTSPRRYRDRIAPSGGSTTRPCVGVTFRLMLCIHAKRLAVLPSVQEDGARLVA